MQPMLSLTRAESIHSAAGSTKGSDRASLFCSKCRCSLHDGYKPIRDFSNVVSL